MATATELTVHAGPMRLAAKSWGPPDGAPVLALHGWLDNAGSFDRLAPLLAQRAHIRLVALDLPGHGLSDHRGPDGMLHFVDWVPPVVAVLDALGWQRATVIGHSMGGAVACLVAATFPERVERTVVIEGLGPLTGEPKDCPTRLRDASLEQLRRWQSESRQPVYPNREHVAALLRKAMAGISEPAIACLLTRGLAEVSGGLTWRSDRRLRGTSALRMTEEQVRVFLRAIQCPVLVVRAHSGLDFDAGVMRARLDCLAHGNLVELPGSHHVHLDEPDAVAALVLPFLLATSSSV